MVLLLESLILLKLTQEVKQMIISLVLLQFNLAYVFIMQGKVTGLSQLKFHWQLVWGVLILDLFGGLTLLQNFHYRPSCFNLEFVNILNFLSADYERVFGQQNVLLWVVLLILVKLVHHFVVGCCCCTLRSITLQVVFWVSLIRLLVQHKLVENHLTLPDKGHMFLRHLLLFRKKLLDNFVLSVTICQVHIMSQVSGFPCVTCGTAGNMSKSVTAMRCWIHSTVCSACKISTEGATFYNLL